jgi:hypothetical protein
MWESLLALTLHFHFGENPFGLELGIRGLVDGPCGLVLGLHTHMEE